MAKLKVKTTQEQTVEIRASLSLSETFLEAEANAIASGRFSCFLRLKMRRRRSALYVAPASLTLDAYLANGLTRTAFLKIITQTAAAIRAAERAHFNLANLELDTRYTLVNALSGQLYFLYQPIRSSRQQNRNGFLREVCSRSTFPTEADMDFLRTFEELVSRPRTVTTQELEAYVRSYSGKRESADPVQTAAVSPCRLSCRRFRVLRRSRRGRWPMRLHRHRRARSVVRCHFGSLMGCSPARSRCVRRSADRLRSCFAAEPACVHRSRSRCSVSGNPALRRIFASMTTRQSAAAMRRSGCATAPAFSSIRTPPITPM